MLCKYLLGTIELVREAGKIECSRLGRKVDIQDFR